MYLANNGFKISYIQRNRPRPIDIILICYYNVAYIALYSVSCLAHVEFRSLYVKRQLGLGLRFSF